ncbi:MerR family transcriptional regulator [Paenibacillus sp. FSL R7-0345]|uniref:MerR family transcriptional regulator n=1 Tax=Paenibacillus sp. FSL R7-0345 TaxID=2954535 RepID=UPI00315A5C4D
MKYSIGEFASILGITADTLRLYEKHDIVRPEKGCRNNYRYFNDLDARNLLSSRWYRSMQIPLQNVAGLINGAPAERVVDSIYTAQLQLEEEIRWSTMLLDTIRTIHNELVGLEDKLCKCRIKQMPGMYRLQQTEKNQLLQKECLKQTVQAWMDLLPFTFYSFRTENTDNLGSGGELDYNWGLALLEEDQQKLGVCIDDSMQYIPSGTCISSVIVTSYEDYLEQEAFQFMLDYAWEQGYNVDGDVYGKILFTERLQDENRTYLEINIPISI